jgi:hypothetical protein
MKGKVIGEPGFTPGQCVAFVKKVSGAPNTSLWRKVRVAPSSYQELTGLIWRLKCVEGRGGGAGGPGGLPGVAARPGV